MRKVCQEEIGRGCPGRQVLIIRTFDRIGQNGVSAPECLGAVQVRVAHDPAASVFSWCPSRASMTAAKRTAMRARRSKIASMSQIVAYGSSVFGSSSASGCDEGSAGTRPGWRPR
jgi:hypothetical protein